MTEVFLGLGSNLGDRKALVDEAVVLLGRLPGTEVTARSSYYKTEPVGPVTQEWYLNIAVALRTELSPSELLAACHAIEADLGRDRSVEVRWGPRRIDIDLIGYGDVSRSDAGLMLPHPRMAERGFVLVPLAEIAAGARIGMRAVADHVAAMGGAELCGVEKLAWPVDDV